MTHYPAFEDTIPTQPSALQPPRIPREREVSMYGVVGLGLAAGSMVFAGYVLARLLAWVFA